MAIELLSGLAISSSEPVDKRLVYATKADLKAQSKATMPDRYTAMCVEDGRLYIFDKSISKADADASETGRFIPYEQVIDLPDALKSAIAKDPSGVNDALSIALPGALREALNNQELKDSGLFVDEDGNIKVGINEEQMEIIDNKIEIKLDDAIRCIEAIDGN